MKLAIDLDGPIVQHGDAHDWWNPDHWLDLEPTPSSLWGMEQLEGDGHELHIVTARTSSLTSYEWARVHGFGRWPLYYTRQKWNVPCHVYLDDSVSVLQGLRLRRLTCVKWVTRNNVNAAGNFSVESWPEFVSLIRSGQVKGRLRRRPRVRP